MKNELYVGQNVRSFSFPFRNRDVEGSEANFIEGKVIAIISGKESPDTCTSFKIVPTRIVEDGVEREGRLVDFVYAPVNGLQNAFSGTSDGVEMLNDANNSLDIGNINIVYIHSVNAYRNGSYIGSFDTFEQAVDWFEVGNNRDYQPHAFANA